MLGNFCVIALEFLNNGNFVIDVLWKWKKNI